MLSTTVKRFCLHFTALFLIMANRAVGEAGVDFSRTNIKRGRMIFIAYSHKIKEGQQLLVDSSFAQSVDRGWRHTGVVTCE